MVLVAFSPHGKVSTVKLVRKRMRHNFNINVTSTLSPPRDTELVIRSRHANRYETPLFCQRCTC